MEWINVLDNLPKLDGNYLAITPWWDEPAKLEFRTHEKKFFQYSEQDYCGYPNEDITHWMELPKTPYGNG